MILEGPHLLFGGCSPHDWPSRMAATSHRLELACLIASWELQDRADRGVPVPPEVARDVSDLLLRELNRKAVA